MGALFSQQQEKQQETVTSTSFQATQSLKRSSTNYNQTKQTKRPRLGDTRTNLGPPPNNHSGKNRSSRKFQKVSSTTLSTMHQQTNQNVPETDKDREEDIRSKVVQDVPIQPQYLLRAKRSEDGKLSLETGGKPLYSSTFFKDISEQAIVVPESTEEKKSGYKAANLERRHEEQTNFLDYQTQRTLRKKQYQFKRTKQVARDWEKVSHQFENINKNETDEGPTLCKEKRKIDLTNKLYLAPLTTVGNLPFRRVCKRLGADVTCGEMAMDRNLLMGQTSEWALVRRHKSEDLFGVQIAGSNVDTITRAAEVIGNHCDIDFLEINCGCPIELVYNRGGGCGLMRRTQKLKKLVWNVNQVIDVPIGVKMRTGVSETSRNAAQLIQDVSFAGASWVTIHGRSRKQRYSKLADWNFIKNDCAKAAYEAKIPLIGNGDVYNWRDVVRAYDGNEEEESKVSTVMIARGALIKPWVFTEIKEMRDWDISSMERLDLYKEYAKYGLDHWGSDEKGIERTRRFLLEWLSFLYRYVPIGLIEYGKYEQIGMSHRAPFFRGRNELETLLGSSQSCDWIKITEILLGKASTGFKFDPRHKSNAWTPAAEDVDTQG